MDSPRPAVVTINSRQARRASSVWGIPNLANRSLQVGLLSSIASRPLSPATVVLAISTSSCDFILALLHFPGYGFPTRAPIESAANPAADRDGHAEFAGARSPSGYDSLNHRRASAALAWSKYRMVAAVKGLQNVAMPCCH